MCFLCLATLKRTLLTASAALLTAGTIALAAVVSFCGWILGFLSAVLDDVVVLGLRAQSASRGWAPLNI